MLELIKKGVSGNISYSFLAILFLFTISQFLIQYWIQSHFSSKANRQIEIYKAEVGKQLEAYKVVMGGNLNRKIRFIEKEYISLSECWASFVEAYEGIKNSIPSFCPSYDFQMIDDDTLERVLKEFGFSNYQVNIMKRSTDKNEKFPEICQFNLHIKVRKLCDHFRCTLEINEIFIDEKIFKKFTRFSSIFEETFWGLTCLKLTKEPELLEKAQRAAYRVQQNECANEKHELLLSIKEYLQKNDFLEESMKNLMK